MIGQIKPSGRHNFVDLSGSPNNGSLVTAPNSVLIAKCCHDGNRVSVMAVTTGDRTVIRTGSRTKWVPLPAQQILL